MSHPSIFEQLIAGEGGVWLRGPGEPSPASRPITTSEVEDARARLVRFEPALRALFPAAGWNGVISSPLLDFEQPPAGLDRLLVKADHQLPMTGSIKARGGVYELLARIERIAQDEGWRPADGDFALLATPEARVRLSGHSVAVASTGNLGFSIGLVGRAFGLGVQVHMSRDAKAWKKRRLVELGADVIEHDCDYTRTVARARAAALATGIGFIDDEASLDLLRGYAVAGDEVVEQLARRGVRPTRKTPLVVYLPCGVGGAPAGVGFGLKERLGDEAVICVFVEPSASACVMAAMAAGGGQPISVFDLGLTNQTVADGLAVPLASALALETARDRIDAVVALPEQAMIDASARAWRVQKLRLEPSAASALAAVAPFLAASLAEGQDLRAATHMAWTTGGSLLPDDPFAEILAEATP